MLLPAVLLAWLLALYPPHGAQTRDPAVELSAAPGTIELVDGSPVALSEPRRVLLKPALSPDGVQEIVIRAETKIENTSGRAIRRLYLSFCYGGNKTNFTAVHGIGASETRTYANESMHVRGGAVPDGPDWALSVRLRGAEFEDGTHWAAPRISSSSLITQGLSQPGSPLIIRKCDLHDDTYSAWLWSVEPQIVAYRLGTVKDIPGDFEVKLGKWVETSEDDRDRASSFTDTGASLGANDQFPRESDTRTLSNGKVITQSFGVAIFVAEVRFANGRVWRQDLGRDALFWDN